ncbi:hypothetical protein [Streptomyces sp. NPDC001137]|uniref:hypothetical protein n=1 Tax=Streptomyces sp. NPDC001137 TaxID=3154378 RepID=UPI0033314173
MRAPHVAGGDVGPAVDAVRPADALEGGEGERLVGVRVQTNVERLAGMLDAAVQAPRQPPEPGRIRRGST